MLNVAEAAEAAKWEKITYLGIAACTTLAVVILSKGHAHYDEPPVRILFRCGSISFKDYLFICNISTLLLLWRIVIDFDIM